MNILFVCSMGRYRSRTACMCLYSRDVSMKFCGTDADADVRITKELADWADIIVCMENRHKSKIRRKWKGLSHKMRVWNIPDVYGLLDDELVHTLRVKYERLESNLQAM